MQRCAQSLPLPLFSVPRHSATTQVERYGALPEWCAAPDSFTDVLGASRRGCATAGTGPASAAPGGASEIERAVHAAEARLAEAQHVLKGVRQVLTDVLVAKAMDELEIARLTHDASILFSAPSAATGAGGASAPAGRAGGRGGSTGGAPELPLAAAFLLDALAEPCPDAVPWSTGGDAASGRGAAGGDRGDLAREACGVLEMFEARMAAKQQLAEGTKERRQGVGRPGPEAWDGLQEAAAAEVWVTASPVAAHKDAAAAAAAAGLGEKRRGSSGEGAIACSGSEAAGPCAAVGPRAGAMGPANIRVALVEEGVPVAHEEAAVMVGTPARHGPLEALSTWLHNSMRRRTQEGRGGSNSACEGRGEIAQAGGPLVLGSSFACCLQG